MKTQLGSASTDTVTRFAIRFFLDANPTIRLSLHTGRSRWGDFNGDGKVDFLVETLSETIVLLGGLTESGELRRGMTLPSRFASMQPIGDVNGDGFDDLAVDNVIVFGNDVPNQTIDLSNPASQLFARITDVDRI